jgi:hypothetical protein
VTIEPVKPIALDPETSAVIHAAQDALAREIRKAELVDDPVAPALLAMGKMLDGLHQLFGATVEGFHATTQTLDQRAAEILRHPIAPDALARLEQAASTGADRRAAELARAHNRRSMLVQVAMVVGGLVIGAGIGYGTANVRLTAAVAGLDRRLTGPDALQWLGLMRDNDIARAARSCASQAGGTACSFALWTDPPPAAAR